MTLTRRNFVSGAIAAAVAFLFPMRVSKAVAAEVAKVPVDATPDWQAVAVELAERLGSYEYEGGESCPEVPCQHAQVWSREHRLGEGDYHMDFFSRKDDEVPPYVTKSDKFVSFETHDVTYCKAALEGSIGTQLPCGREMKLSWRKNTMYLQQNNNAWGYSGDSQPEDKPFDPRRLYGDVTKKLYERNPTKCEELLSGHTTARMSVEDYFAAIGEKIPLSYFDLPCRGGRVFPEYCTCSSHRCSYEYEEYDCDAECHAQHALAGAVMAVTEREVTAEQMRAAEEHYRQTYKATQPSQGYAVNAAPRPAFEIEEL